MTAQSTPDIKNLDQAAGYDPENPPEHLDRVIDSGFILYLEKVTVSFDGFKALNNMNLHLEEGELRCIIGPNGAGKTTLMDVITGKTRPDEGVVSLGRNIDLLRLSEHRIVDAGVGRKFQKPTVFEAHTVYENLELAMRSKRGVWFTLFAKLNQEMRDRIDEVVELLGLSEERYKQGGLLSHGQKQWLEIGMLLMQNPDVLLLDEPAAGMSLEETSRTIDLLKELQGKHTIVVVDHDMDFIRSIANTVTVMHNGQVLAEGEMNEVQQDPKVIEVYLGE